MDDVTGEVQNLFRSKVTYIGQNASIKLGRVSLKAENRYFVKILNIIFVKLN